MCGSKTTSQANQQSSFTPPPEVMQNYAAVTQQAQNVAATPYQGYSGNLVAGINAQQNTGIGAVNAASGIQNPYNTGATGYANSSTGAVQQFSPEQIAQYESPYQSDVIKATEAEIQNQNQQQAANLTSGAIGSGAFGGDRAGIAQAALAGQQDIANNATLANLNNQNYQQALGEFNTQQGVQQNQYQRQLAAAGMLGQLGQTAQGEALNEANAQTNAGTLQQTTRQAQDTARYNQFLQQQAYPFETTGWLANIVEGIGSQSGGSSSGQTTTQGNAGSQIAGGLLGLASFLARGGRVPHRDQGGGIYLPQPFDPTAVGPTGIGGGTFIPRMGQLAVGHTMPTQGAPAAPATAASGQDMAQMAKAVQGAGKAITNSPFGDQISDAAQDLQLGVGQDDVLAGGLPLGLGGIGAMARGGIVRPGYGDGGAPGGFQLNAAPRPMGVGPAQPASPAAAQPSAPIAGPLMHDPGPAQPALSGHLMHDPGPGLTGGSVGPQILGGGIASPPVVPVQRNRQQAPPSSIASPSPAAPSTTWNGVKSSNPGDYPAGFLTGQLPQQNGIASGWGQPPQGPALWNFAGPGGGNGAGPASGVGTSGSASGGSGSGWARGGIVGRPHYDDGGIVPSGDPMFDMQPEALLLNATAPPTGIGAAAALPAPPALSGADYASQMPAPNVAQENAAARLGDAAQLPAPESMQSGEPIPMPPVRPAGLGAAKDMNEGLSPEQAKINSAASVDFNRVHGLDQNGDPIAAPSGIAAAPPAEDQTFNRMIGIESKGHQFGPDGTPLTSPKGAIGIAQVEPGTGPYAAKLAGLPWDRAKLDSDPAYNLALGKAYYQDQLKTFGSPDKAAAAYNAGPAALKRAMAAANANGGSYLDYLPKETQDYVANATGTAQPALAYDGGRTGVNAPAAQAISAAAPQPGGIAPPAPSTQTSMPQFPDNVPTPESGRTGLFGLNLSPETRQLMLSAGLGIAGATGRSFLGNVGSGALTGIAAARQNANLSSEVGLRQAQTQTAQIENQLKMQQLNWIHDYMQKHAQGISNSANSEAPTINTQTITAGSSPAPAPVGSQSGVVVGAAQQPAAVPASQNPIALRAQAQQLQDEATGVAMFNPAMAERLQANAQQLLAQANEINRTGRISTPDGKGGFMIQNAPGFVGAAATQAGATSAAEGAAKSQFDLTEVTDPKTGVVSKVPVSSLLTPGAGTSNVAKLPGYVTEGQDQLMKEEPAITSALQTRQQVRQRMNAIAEVIQNYQTGKWAEPSAEIVAHLKAAGIPIGATDTANPEAYEKFIKNQMQNVFGDVKAMGGQPRVAEIQGFQKAAAGPSLQPGANVAILGQGLGILDSLDKHDNDYINAKYGPGGNPAMSSRLAFDQKWLSDPKNQLGNFVDAETKNLSYKGQPAPKSPADAVKGQVYQSPSGKRMRWTGTGWVPAPWGSGHEAKTFGAATESP